MDTPLKPDFVFARVFAFGLAAFAAGCLLAGPVAAQENPYELAPDQITELAKKHGGGGGDTDVEAVNLQEQMSRYFGGMGGSEDAGKTAGIQPAAGEGEAGETKYRYDPKRWDPLEPTMPERLFHNIPKRDIIKDKK